MKILIVNQNMKMGGIANSLYNMILELKKDVSHNVELLLFDPYIDNKFSNLLEIIPIHTSFPLGYSYINQKKAYTFFSKVEYIKHFFFKINERIIGKNKNRLQIIKQTKHIGEYDVCISFSNDMPINDTLIGCNDFVLNCVNSKKKIAWIHNDLKKLGMTPSYLTQRYAKFDKVINVSQYCKDTFDKMAPRYVNKSLLIHNYIDVDKTRRLANEYTPFQKKQITFVTVARIANNQKRIDRIIKITKLLKQKEYIFKWYVVGDGPDKNEFMQEVKKYKLEDFLSFVGFKKNPYPYIKHADCLVLTSDYEAQGMVLTESLILNTPVITTDIPAVHEFVKNDIFGKIVDTSTNGLFEALETIILNKERLTIYKKEIINSFNNTSNDFLNEFNTLFN